MSAAAIDTIQVQRALVCMLYDPAYAARVRGEGPLAELGERERALLRAVDPRALRTDAMRRARAVQAILEEYPVSAALLGVPAVDRFFSSPAFRAAVFERGSMALSFGTEFLKERALGVGALEAAIARARRPDRPRPPGLGCAANVAALVVPAGTLEWYQQARARLGADPLRALAALRRPWTQRPPKRGREHLLVEAKEGGEVSIGGASEALVDLLRAADPPRPRAEVVAAAIALGAEADEADELVADLLGDGLLAES
ncbi:MAG: hypothetical protein H6711_24260 [Myxococcales bacterium]|nr:hypothetical protein [Myxococcales bacterium]